MDTLVGTSIGGYTLVRLLGAGGMGSVYLANDPAIGQQVAVKVIRTDLDAYTDSSAAQMALERFRQEARAVAGLDQLHILPLYRYGEEETPGGQRAYMIMQYRPEGSLWDWLRRRADITAGHIQPSQAELSIGLPINWPLSTTEVAEYLQQASSALQYAHDRGIVHRDIKPANFLLRIDIHEKQIHLLLSDFGLAKVFTASSATNTILGTPTYMAPEQFEGAARPESDQYALAVMAYYLLAGRPPFEGDPMQLMHQHLSAAMPALATFNPALPASINGVLARALAKQPEQRFPSIATFAEAFAQAVKAPPSSPSLRQQVSEIGRGPASLTQGQGDLSPVAGLARSSANDQAGYHTPGPLVLPGAPDPVGTYGAATVQAQTMHNVPSPAPTIYPAQGSVNTPSPTQQQFAQGYPPLPVMPGYQGPGQQKVGRRGALGCILGGTALAVVAAGTGVAAYVYVNGQNQSGQTGQPNHPGQTGSSGQPQHAQAVLTGHSGAVTSLSWLADGSQLATGSEDYTVRLWSAQGGSATRTITTASAVDALAWNADGTVLALGGEDHAVVLWRSSSGSSLSEPGWGAPVKALAWNSQFLYIGTFGNGVHALDTANRKHYGKSLPLVRVNGLAISPDSTLVAVALESGLVYFADIDKSWVPAASIQSKYGAARAVAWSPDGQYVAVGYAQNIAVVYSTKNRRASFTLTHQAPVTSVSWQPAATAPSLATGSEDSLVNIWQLGATKSQQNQTTYTGHSASVLAVAWSSTNVLASASQDRTVILWQPPT